MLRDFEYVSEVINYVKIPSLVIPKKHIYEKHVHFPVDFDLLLYYSNS